MKEALLPTSGLAIAGLEIGGAHGSAYVTDHALLARLGGDDSIETTQAASDPKDVGNYLATALGEQQTSAWTSWGYWGLTYDHPDTGVTEQINADAAMWVAGARTPADIMGLVSSEFEGTYTGGAHGCRITASGSTGMVGTSRFTINLSETSVDGTLTFPNDGVVMAVDTTILGNRSGFVGGVTAINGVPVARVNSEVTGGFFGISNLSTGDVAPAAIAGGYTVDAGATQFLGVFDADLRTATVGDNTVMP